MVPNDSKRNFNLLASVRDSQENSVTSLKSYEQMRQSRKEQSTMATGTRNTISKSIINNQSNALLLNSPGSGAASPAVEKQLASSRFATSEVRH